ncbi:hypothetical protein [Streptomyces sp. NBC_01439]|uniref:hypothetical protein n=1 Tax=Streptomyces sp. NBC_01439 TaxID=2903867 RepID=UPI002E2E0A14|nr:hypothetical protein [Streptomyces sp. NBC_01439]
MISAEQRRAVERELRKVDRELSARKPPPPGSGSVSSRPRLTVRIVPYSITRTDRGSIRAVPANPNPPRVIRSGGQGPLIHRSAAEITRFRALGYWGGFGVEFPPCECARCRKSPERTAKIAERESL